MGPHNPTSCYQLLITLAWAHTYIPTHTDKIIFKRPGICQPQAGACFVNPSLLTYIANCSRWKSFVVAELNFNSLENFYGWTVPLHGQSLLPSNFTRKVSRYRSISETFPPQTICNIQYMTASIIIQLQSQKCCPIMGFSFVQLAIATELLLSI